MALLAAIEPHVAAPSVCAYLRPSAARTRRRTARDTSVMVCVAFAMVAFMSCVHCIGPWLRQVASAGHFAHLSEILVRMPRYAHIYGSGPLERTIVCLVLSSQCHARSTCRSAYTLNVHTTGRLSGAGYTGSGRCGRRHAVSASVCAYLRLSAVRTHPCLPRAPVSLAR